MRIGSWSSGSNRESFRKGTHTYCLNRVSGYLSAASLAVLVIWPFKFQNVQRPTCETSVMMVKDEISDASSFRAALHNGNTNWVICSFRVTSFKVLLSEAVYAFKSGPETCDME